MSIIDDTQPGPSLDDILAQLAAAITAIEADYAASGAPAGVSIALARNRAALYAAMDVLGSWINAFLAATPSGAEIQAAKERVTGLIRSWSRTGPFFDRSFGKLRGHPGDYETIEFVYNCRPSGADLRARIFDDYFLWTMAARAARNNLMRLVAWLGEGTQAWAAQGCAQVRVLSLSSGPARELAMLADDPVFGEIAAVTCVDGDSEALRYVRNRLNGRMNGRLTYLRDDALCFARGPNRPSQPYHIIYVAVLCNYLNADQVRRLVEDCHGLLAPGGRLIMGNFSVGLPANERVLLGWLLEWRVATRSEDEYRRIFAGTPFGADRLHFEHEPLAVNFLVMADRSL